MWIHERLDPLMETKFPIHLGRMEVIKPTMKDNEEMSTFFSRIHNYINVKLNLTASSLRTLPITVSPKMRCLKKQEMLSNYLNEFGERRGSKEIADIDFIKNCILTIEANCR